MSKTFSKSDVELRQQVNAKLYPHLESLACGCSSSQFLMATKQAISRNATNYFRLHPSESLTCDTVAHASHSILHKHVLRTSLQPKQRMPEWQPPPYSETFPASSYPLWGSPRTQCKLQNAQIVMASDPLSSEKYRNSYPAHIRSLCARYASGSVLWSANSRPIFQKANHLQELSIYLQLYRNSSQPHIFEIRSLDKLQVLPAFYMP